jgi:hemerythrin-like domain-containing protein
MRPVERLKDEHRMIEKILDAFDVFVADVADGYQRRQDIDLFMEFFKGFVDMSHHGKEEDILFVVLEETGFRRGSGPLWIMLTEHVEGRRLISVMDRVARKRSRWSEDDRRYAVSAGTEYTRLLREHIRKEEGILFPMAEEGLSRAQRFDRFASRMAARGEDRRLQAIAMEILARYGERADARSISGAA